MEKIKQNVKHIYVLKDEYKRQDYRFNTNINSKKYSMFKDKCKKEGITPSGFIRNMIDNFIKDKLEVVERNGFYTLNDSKDSTEE